MEKKALNNRNKIRIILFTIFIIAVLGIFGITTSVKCKNYERIIENSHEKALISLDEYLSNIESGLLKTTYVSTPSMFNKLATEVWRESLGAKNSLSSLPSNEKPISDIYKFLSQTGEFMMSLQKKSMNGENLTESERAKLRELYKYSNELLNKIKDITFNIENNNISFDVKNSNLLENKDTNSNFLKDIDDSNEVLSDFPSLIYDGPFSDHIENVEPKMLTNKKEISKDKGLEIAKKIYGKDADQLKFTREDNGKIGSFIYEDNGYTIAITKKGGIPLYMICDKFAGENNIKYEDAVLYSKDFLENIGYHDMKESYYFCEDGICTVNFAYNKDNIIFYPDLIKVSVNMQNGEITSFDASGYIYNHHNREKLTPLISKDDALKKINNSLKIIDSQLVLIPTEWKSERYCYEIHCKADNGQEILSYIDSLTGEEDNLLLLLYGDGGVLTK